MNNPIEAFQLNTNSTILNFFESHQHKSWWNLLGIENQHFWNAVNYITNLQFSMIDNIDTYVENRSVVDDVNHVKL